MTKGERVQKAEAQARSPIGLGVQALVALTAFFGWMQAREANQDADRYAGSVVAVSERLQSGDPCAGQSERWNPASPYGVRSATGDNVPKSALADGADSWSGPGVREQADRIMERLGIKPGGEPERGDQ